MRTLEYPITLHSPVSGMYCDDKPGTWYNSLQDYHGGTVDSSKIFLLIKHSHRFFHLALVEWWVWVWSPWFGVFWVPGWVWWVLLGAVFGRVPLNPLTAAWLRSVPPLAPHQTCGRQTGPWGHRISCPPRRWSPRTQGGLGFNLAHGVGMV